MTKAQARKLKAAERQRELYQEMRFAKCHTLLLYPEAYLSKHENLWTIHNPRGDPAVPVGEPGACVLSEPQLSKRLAWLSADAVISVDQRLKRLKERWARPFEQ